MTIQTFTLGPPTKKNLLLIFIKLKNFTSDLLSAMVIFAYYLQEKKNYIYIFKAL